MHTNAEARDVQMMNYLWQAGGLGRPLRNQTLPGDSNVVHFLGVLWLSG